MQPSEILGHLQLGGFWKISLSLSLSLSFFYLFFETVSHYVTILPQSPSAGITDVPHHAWLFYFIFFNIAFYYWLKWFK
jgi:hypothetical protein